MPETVATNEMVKSYPLCRDSIKKAFLFYVNPTAEECPNSMILFTHENKVQAAVWHQNDGRIINFSNSNNISIF